MSNLNEQGNQEIDVIHLKNGTVRRGKIISRIPEGSIKIITADGYFYVDKVEDIEKITKEQPEINPNEQGNKQGTKKCPYCAEEINIAALKCKHCGEILDKRNFEKVRSQDIPPVTAPKRRLENQNFLRAIYTGIGVIVLTILSEFDYGEELKSWEHKIAVMAIVLNVRLWFYFRTYLRNFKSRSAVPLTGWIAAITIIYSVFLLPLAFVGNDTGKMDSDTAVLLLFCVVVGLILYFASMLLAIILGYVIKNIEDDFVGLLRPLGMAYAYLTPIAAVLLIVDLTEHSKFYGYCADLIGLIPVIILIRIFYRAYQEDY